MADENARVAALLEQIAQQGDAWKQGNAGAREALVANAERLCTTLMTPNESMLLTQWAQPTHAVAIKIASDLGIFDALAADNGSPKAIQDIKTTPPAEPALVGRVLRHLAAMGTVRELGVDTFAPTPVALAMTGEAYKDWSTFMLDFFYPCFRSTPEMVKQNGYNAPNSVNHTPFHVAYQAPAEPIWVYWAKQEPLQGKRFANMMHAYTKGRPQWFQEGYYPVKERLIEGADNDPESVFLVDLGSGAGHDASRMLELFGSQVPGKVVIQDRPEIIEIAEKEAAPEIVKMAHDFFNEQPVKGARAYFMHSIIHDWPDDDAQQILRSIVPAMKRGYSKILVNDFVVSNQDAPWLMTAMDWMVMIGLSARERTVDEFHRLVESVGLKITNFYKHPQGLDSVVEMELA